MPCYDERSSPEYISREYSKQIGELTEMLCEACGKLDAYGHMKALSGNTQKWWAHHKAADEKRRKAAEERKVLKSIADKAMKRLSPEEIEALQFVGRMKK